MKRTKKKILSLLLTAVMVLSLTPISAFAAYDGVGMALCEIFPDVYCSAAICHFFDWNAEDILTSAKALAVTAINVSNCRITSLEGIHVFPNLSVLNVSNNRLRTVDLSHNTELTSFSGSQKVAAYYEHNISLNQYYVDMNSMVGSENLDKVSVSDVDWAYNSSTGILTYCGSGIPNSANYNYNTGTPYPMSVVMSLQPIKYSVTVTGGTVGGGISEFSEGETVNINADTAPDVKAFDKWVSISKGVTFANANAKSTSFIMPNNAVTVSVTYRDAISASITPASDDFDLYKPNDTQTTITWNDAAHHQPHRKDI